MMKAHRWGRGKDEKKGQKETDLTSTTPQWHRRHITDSWTNATAEHIEWHRETENVLNNDSYN